MDTLCEGVEHPEQVEFLREIGCTRIQGFYYGKAIPFEDIVSKVETSSYIEYENPAEAEYYASIGRLNLYDLSSFSNENEDIMAKYFDTLPMAVIEYDRETLRVIRCNRSYKDYLKRYFDVTNGVL